MQFGACARSAHALVCILGAALIVGGCQRQPADDNAMSLTPATFSDLPGWYNDAQADALPAWRRSCERIANLAPDIPIDPNSVGGPASAWQPTCARIASLDDGDTEGLRRLIETELVPYHVDNGATGLFTGYFEPELVGSRRPDARHNVPLYRLPDDHLTIDLGDFDPELAGRRLIGRANGARLTPYHERAAIDAGALAGKGAELIWLTDPLDAFILHVQGSGKVLLADGQAVRIGFAGHNGHTYNSIGRALIDAGELRPGKASWDGIRAWLTDHPDRMAEMLGANPRYIFFREIDGDGPIGAEGVALTPQRSLAVDRRWLPLGIPIWLDAEHPLPGEARLQRLMIAQDTGSAIRGRVRGDYYWGSGAEALKYAGRMSSQGRYFIFLPHAITPPRRVAGR